MNVEKSLSHANVCVVQKMCNMMFASVVIIIKRRNPLPAHEGDSKINIVNRLQTILSNMEFMGTESLTLSQKVALGQIKSLLQNLDVPGVPHSIIPTCPCDKLKPAFGSMACGVECTDELNNNHVKSMKFWRDWIKKWGGSLPEMSLVEINEWINSLN